MFAIAYIITAAVASFFPVSPVELTPAGMVSSTTKVSLTTGPMLTLSSQNWSSVMFSGVAFLALIDYMVRGRKQYVPPVRHVHKM